MSTLGDIPWPQPTVRYNHYYYPEPKRVKLQDMIDMDNVLRQLELGLQVGEPKESISIRVDHVLAAWNKIKECEV